MQTKKIDDIKQIYSNLDTGKNIYDNRVVKFVNHSLGKILRHQGFDISLIIPKLKELFDTSLPIYSEPEIRKTGHKKHPNFVGYHNYLNKINYKSQQYWVRMTIQEEKTNSKDYIPNALHSVFVSDVVISKIETTTDNIQNYEKNDTDNTASYPRLLTRANDIISTKTDAKLQQFLEKAKKTAKKKKKKKKKTVPCCWIVMTLNRCYPDTTTV